MQIPQVAPWLGADEIAAVTQTLTDNWITEGPQTARFGARLNALLDAPYGAFAPNGTLALFLALMALEVGPGDEVLVPDITFIASATAVLLAGAQPVFVDVDPQTYQIDVAACAARLSPRTRAVMPVHLYGGAANLEALLAFARAHDLLVIEDAAQALGAHYGGRPLGAFGDAGCFSFFADKTITTGEGGYVVCRDPAVYERLLLLRNQGRRDRGSFVHPAIGYNFRITDLQAAIGLAQLDRLDQIIAAKRAILGWYREELDGLPEVSFLPDGAGCATVPFRAVLFVPEAAPLMHHLAERGVQPRGFFHPLHQQPCFAHLGRAQGGPLDLDDAHYPHAIAGHRHGLTLPAFPTLSREQVAYIGAQVRDFFGR